MTHTITLSYAVDPDYGMDSSPCADARSISRSSGKGVDPSRSLALNTYTVGDALDDYLAHFRGESLSKTRNAIERHIRPALGRLPVHALTSERLIAFQNKLASAPATWRANKMGQRKTRPEMLEMARRRRATANRIFTSLRAALNRAYEFDKISDRRRWARVKPFKNVDVPRIRYLDDEEMRRLVAAAPGWFRPLIQAALFSGARWSELGELRVQDVDLNAGTLHLRRTKSRRSRHCFMSDECRRFFAAVRADRKKRTDLIFLNPRGLPLRPSEQTRPMRQACIDAEIEPAGFHVLRHSFASRLVMNGVPISVVAEALGHSDQRVTAKYYAHLAPGYVRAKVCEGLNSLDIF